jgi:ATP-dependent helicase/nuclease subunit A
MPESAGRITSVTSELRLPFVEEAPLPDGDARAAAVDPSRNVVLEASAGTGKTRVLVERYVNLLRAGVEPEHILAVTFTRKAAAEMRQRIIDRLKEASRLSEFDAGRWRDLKSRLGDIAISTIDAFCLSLLREFPLEADVDPGFELAADTEIPRLMEESLDGAFRICRSLAGEDVDVALVFAQLGERRLRSGIAALLDRRLVASGVLRRFLAAGPKNLTPEEACRRAAARLRDILSGMPYGCESFLADGPARRPQFAMLARDLRELMTGPPLQSSQAAADFDTREAQAAFRTVIDRLRAYFLTQEGDPRGKAFAGTGFRAEDCDTEDAWKRHRHAAAAIAPAIAEAIRGFRRDLNVVLSRGVWRVFAVALAQYERTLESHALLDFPGVLARAVKLLQDLDEFAESRLRLEARYRHVLLDEFQDTSRAQWELVRQLVRTWGEGLGASDDAIPPSIFIVGDRKQSIYGFRDADVALVEDAAAFIEELRPGIAPRQAITVSFRSAPAILDFVNDLFASIAGASDARRDAFRYDERDRFPVADVDTPTMGLGEPFPVLGLITGETVHEAAGRVADEIVGFLSGTLVRDRTTGVRRPATPADIAILFRSRDSHREFESALAERGVSTYVYKGLGFFESDEVQDVVALLRYLADPHSELRASAFLRSRLIRLSDGAVARLGPALATSILAGEEPAAVTSFDDEDRRVLGLLRSALPHWLALVDRQTPSELLVRILSETAYAYELRGARRQQARENIKKLRSMIRRAENRGYATVARLADHLERLAVGDESNAAIDAIDAVSLMTVHAAKGLEFPIVFVVNLGRGVGGVRAPIRVVGETAGDESVAIADYQSEADDDALAREREETKRLLYVALTRARDHVYLAASVPEGRFRAGRGSLAEVLPDDVKSLFVKAALGEELAWVGPSGKRHHIVQPDRPTEPRRLSATPPCVPALDDFVPF